MAPYTAELISKAPWTPSGSTIENADSSSRISHAQDRSSSCGTNLLDLKIGHTGNITSPNYPDDYPPNSECTWWLKVDNYWNQDRIFKLILFYIHKISSHITDYYF